MVLLTCCSSAASRASETVTLGLWGHSHPLRRIQTNRYGHIRFLGTLRKMIGSKTPAKITDAGMHMAAATQAEKKMASGLMTTAGTASTRGSPVT